MIRVINPYYVFLTGSLGIFIALLMFQWNYPLPDDPIGRNFVNVQPFLIWLFFLVVYCCLLTILFLPLWGMLFYLIRNRISVQDAKQKSRTISYLSLQAVLLTAMVFFLIRVISQAQIGIELAAYVPRGHSIRILILSAYTFVTALPALLGIILIHGGTQELSQKIEDSAETQEQLFPLINEVLFLRGTLQNYLAILGLILSLIPINTAGLRSILVALDPNNDHAFPVTNVILYGLTFTIILLLIYIPAHLALSETSRKLRNRLCPLGSLDSLTKDLERRKALDELLQTNISVTQNLKTGLIALAPLVTSLISSILKINLAL